MNFVRTLIPLLACLPFLPACAISGTVLQDAAAEINATFSLDPRILDVGDSIQVEFLDNPDWSQQVKVKADGFGNFRFLGEIELKEKTEKELVEQIVAAYDATLQDSNVEVRVADWAPRSAYVAGEVRTRGTIALSGKRLSLVEALVKNGGHSWRTAQLRRIHFIRWMPDTASYKRWFLDASVGEWDADPIYLQAYDIIYVPPTVIARINNWVDIYIRRNIPLPILINRATASL